MCTSIQGPVKEHKATSVYGSHGVKSTGHMGYRGHAQLELKGANPLCRLGLLGGSVASYNWADSPTYNPTNWSHRGYPKPRCK